MKHIHSRTGKEYEVGKLVDFNNVSCDMCIITYWYNEDGSATSENPTIVGYYFGTYDKDTTDKCIEQYLSK